MKQRAAIKPPTGNGIYSRIEQRRFEHIDRLLPCLAVYLIIAWRILFACRLARSCPDIDCEAVFEPSEWKSVWTAIHRYPPPQTPPRLESMVRLIAQLGGYVNRPNRRDPPGPQTLWLGLQRMRDLAWAWDAGQLHLNSLKPTDTPCNRV